MKQISVLTEKASSDDALPRQIEEALTQSTRPRFSGPDRSAARRLLPEEPAWLVPAANGELCIARIVYPLIARLHGEPLAPVVAVACATQAATVAGKLVVTQSLATAPRASTSSPTRVLGVLPDGATGVRLVFARGKSAPDEPIRNGYEIVVEDPERLQFLVRQGNGTRAESVRLVTPSLGTGPTRPPGEGF